MTSSGEFDIFVAKIHAFDLGILGFLESNITQGNSVNVCFPGGVILKDIFSESLIPSSNYYLDKNCQFKPCNKCAKRYVGTALTDGKLLTGVDNGCCGCCN